MNQVFSFLQSSSVFNLSALIDTYYKETFLICLLSGKHEWNKQVSLKTVQHLTWNLEIKAEQAGKWKM